MNTADRAQILADRRAAWEAATRRDRAQRADRILRPLLVK